MTEKEEMPYPIFSLEREKVEWLKIQEKKLRHSRATLNQKNSKPEILERWIKDTEEDIAKTKKELGYEN